MIRKLAVFIATRLPPKTVTGRIIPWTTLFLAVFGAAWTWFQYSQSLQIQRASTVLSIHRQFLQAFPKGSDQFTQRTQQDLILLSFEIQCQVFRDTAQGSDETTPEEILTRCDQLTIEDRDALNRISAQRPKNARETIRDRLTKATEVDGPGADRMITFFRSLQVCVERNLCDRSIAIELFQRDIVGLLNTTCSYGLQRDGFRAESQLLAQFLGESAALDTAYWNTDPRREDMFFCSYLRRGQLET